MVIRGRARPLIEAYLLHEGANAIDGLLDLLDAGAKPRAFALGGLRAITPGTGPDGAKARSHPAEIPHGPASSRVPSHVAEGAVPTMQNDGNHVAPTELVPWYIIASKLALALGTSLAMIGGA